jgi:hypothetical protein
MMSEATTAYQRPLRRDLAVSTLDYKRGGTNQNAYVLGSAPFLSEYWHLASQPAQSVSSRLCMQRSPVSLAGRYA